jgi:hypothetical protein
MELILNYVKYDFDGLKLFFDILTLSFCLLGELNQSVEFVCLSLSLRQVRVDVEVAVDAVH